MIRQQRSFFLSQGLHVTTLSGMSVLTSNMAQVPGQEAWCQSSPRHHDHLKLTKISKKKKKLSRFGKRKWAVTHM